MAAKDPVKTPESMIAYVVQLPDGVGLVDAAGKHTVYAKGATIPDDVAAVNSMALLESFGQVTAVAKIQPAAPVVT